MPRSIRIFIKVIAILLLLLIAVAIALPLVIDPNDYKQEISELANKHTGRTLTIKGDIDLSLFPWLGIELGEMELSNAKGFAKRPLARFDSADVRVKLLPLITGDIEIGKITLHGMQLTLQRKTSGLSNWADLSKQAKSTETPAARDTKPAEEKQAPQDTSSPTAALAALAIEGIEIKQASVIWDDKQTRQHYTLAPFNLEVGKVALKQAIPLQMDMAFKSKQPAMSGKLSLEASAVLDPLSNIYQLKNLQLDKQIQSKLLPAGKMDGRFVAGNVTANLTKQVLAVDDVRLDVYGVTLNSDARVTKLLSSPQYTASLALDKFSPWDLASQLKIALPKTADGSVLQAAQLNATVKGNLDTVSLNKIIMQLDDSELTGTVKVSNFAKPAIRYDLNLSQIDADRYMPPAPANPKKNGSAVPGKRKTASATPAAAASQAVQLPMKQLRALNLNGTLRINKLKAMNLRSTDIRITTLARNGRIRLHPLGAQMYKGSYSGDMSLDVRGKTPLISMNESIKKVQIGPLLKDFWGDDIVRGQANLDMNIKTRGTDPLAIRKAMNGAGKVLIKDGEIKDIDMAQIQKVMNELDDDIKSIFKAPNIAQGLAIIDKIKAKAAAIKNPKASRPTYFSDITGTFTITRGLLTNPDLRVRIPFGRVKGEGQVDLVKMHSRYTAYIKLTSKGKVQSGKTYEQMNKTPLMIHFNGPLEKISPDVDFKAYASAEGKKAQDKLKASLKKKIQKKTDKKIQREKDKLKQKLDDKLKKLFKF